ncbi:hypothetical protein [Ovoidimarina sediminis]|uniref:hypothetical protein n=1 Tax=Ovoidimarina sediminis TaxID=3079856 RepID=UPI00290F8949|nr:hypothetical protein [Rhodophyticola sp. MJ-SS7]MDU8945637.1 hypothetical protein [Rhodophyticola sp. MJ-SS7]
MRVLICLAVLALAACASRPLTETERAFTGTVLGDAIDIAPVRITRGAAVGLLRPTVPPKPRTTCREKLFPPRDLPVKGRFPAFVLSDRVFYTREHWRADFLAGYPEAKSLRQSMRFAHELVHVWQWQNREVTGYHPLKAMTEHIESDDPYLIEIDPEKPFLAYAYEQQGVIVEEFVCCRALAPTAPRTAELLRLVRQVFPQAAARESVPRDEIALPWEGAELNGICG